MSEKHTTGPEKITGRSEVVHMTAATEAASIIEEIAGPRSVKDAMNRVAFLWNRELDRVGCRPIKTSRVEDIWRGEAKAIRAEEMDALRRVRDKTLKQEARDEHRLLVSRIERLEAALRIQDEDFFGDQMHALRRSIGRVDRPLDRSGDE